LNQDLQRQAARETIDQRGKLRVGCVAGLHADEVIREDTQVFWPECIFVELLEKRIVRRFQVAAFDLELRGGDGLDEVDQFRKPVAESRERVRTVLEYETMQWRRVRGVAMARRKHKSLRLQHG